MRNSIIEKKVTIGETVFHQTTLASGNGCFLKKIEPVGAYTSNILQVEKS